MLSNSFIDRLKSVNLKSIEPSYNFLDVIAKSDNENVISDWLAFLLDAKKCGSEAPLKLFCQLVEVEFENGEITIDREYTLDNRRRVDIIIKMENSWIVIENKINSMECNEQTIDYETKIANELNGQNISVYYVYLKPTYNKSNPANSNFNVLTYGELANIWENIKSEDFVRKENYVYFSEFIKLIKGRYAMSKELQFDENTKLYIEYREQFHAAEKSFNYACLAVREKLMNLLNAVFPDEEGWKIDMRFKGEFIQIYKTSWGNDLHFEIGTWLWQRNSKNISFERLISNDVQISYCLHAERKQVKYSLKFKDIETANSKLFCTEHYNFGSEENCMVSINAIAARLQEIKNTVAPIIDKLLVAEE